MKQLAAGTQITCENGHPICEVVVPLVVGGVVSARMFTNFTAYTDPPPRDGDVVRPCTCRAAYIGYGRDGGWQVHTAAGWWPQ